MILLFVICMLFVCTFILAGASPWVILLLTPLVVGAISTFPRGFSARHRSLMMTVCGVTCVAFAMQHMQSEMFSLGYIGATKDHRLFTFSSSALLVMVFVLNTVLCITHLRLSGLPDRWALLYAILGAVHALNGRFSTISAWSVTMVLLLFLLVRTLPRMAPHFSAASLTRCCLLVIGIVAVLCLCAPSLGQYAWPLAAACGSLLGGAPLVGIAVVPVAAWHSELWSHDAGWMTGPFAVVTSAVLWGLVALGVFRAYRRHRRATVFSGETDTMRTVSVVIPAMNEADNIQRCLQAALRDACVCEAIVVDGGSTDQTTILAEQGGAHIVQHDDAYGAGRGGHIRSGVHAARGDVVLVVHADTVLPPDAAQSALRFLQQHCHVMGGALGSIFDSDRAVLRCIEAANDFRAAFLGISFGDQVQFFRRRAAMSESLVPDYPLMEDVELSMRLSQYSTPAFCFGAAQVSSRSWGGDSRKRALLIIRLVAVFLWTRWRGTPDVNAMYRQYYGDRGEG